MSLNHQIWRQVSVLGPILTIAEDNGIEISSASVCHFGPLDVQVSQNYPKAHDLAVRLGLELDVDRDANSYAHSDGRQYVNVHFIGSYAGADVTVYTSIPADEYPALRRWAVQ